MEVISHAPDGCPALVLNADYRPLRYFPLSLWGWQDALKAVFLEEIFWIILELIVHDFT